MVSLENCMMIINLSHKIIIQFNLYFRSCQFFFLSFKVKPPSLDMLVTDLEWGTTMGTTVGTTKCMVMSKTKFIVMGTTKCITGDTTKCIIVDTTKVTMPGTTYKG